MTNSFSTIADQHRGKLDLFVPVVDRVHGPTHPEFHEVKSLWDTIAAKLTAGEPDLTGEFDRLREVTHDYAIPGDVCESFEAVYLMLSDLDSAYRAD